MQSNLARSFAGFVAVDQETFLRIKIKSPQYMAVRKLTWCGPGDLNRARKLMLDAIRSNPSTDFVAKCAFSDTKGVGIC